MLTDQLTEATLVILALTAAIMVAGVARRAKRSRDDFGLLMLLFVLGWFSTDLLASSASELLQSAASLAYMLILVGFLALMVRRLGWATARVERPPN